MSSTELNLGLPNSKRPSSRVLKPPGGGHSDIFGEPEVKANAPRPKYNQQNSSNLNCVMNTVDPNEALQKTRKESEEVEQRSETNKQFVDAAQQNASSKDEASNMNGQQNASQGRVRVPPGGFSSGLW